jgi:hypothetical protein
MGKNLTLAISIIGISNIQHFINNTKNPTKLIIRLIKLNFIKHESYNSLFYWIPTPTT